MELSQYFAQLNIFNLSVFLLSFIIFDSLGSRIAFYIKPPQYMRLTYWIWGMGLFALALFLLHLLLPFRKEYIWLILLLFSLISVPSYIKNKNLFTLISEVKSFIFPIFILFILFKPIYFLISAPPYYADEMNYQFYPPARLFIEAKWPFLSSVGGAASPSLYEMIPKTLNTIYWAFFSLTGTYVVARLVHFFIVYSVLYTISIFIAKNINKTAGIVYSIFGLLLSANYIYFSTLGYVDAAPASLSILFLILIVDYLAKPQKGKLYPASIILGLMVGMKYTISIFALTTILTAVLISLYTRRKKILSISFKSLKLLFPKNIKILGILSIITLIFGGYWYLKNLLISGNPIYPIFFKCMYGWQCGVGNTFFSGWSFPFDILHAWNILMELFQSNAGFFYSTFILLIVSIIMSLIYKLKYSILLTATIISSIFLEIALSRNNTGFVSRYYFHWLLLIPLILTLPLTLLNIKKIAPLHKIIFISSIVLLLFFPAIVLTKNIKRLYEGDYVPGYVRNYSMHRINMNNWLDYYYPAMNEFIKWCGNKRPMQDILVIDPNLIWYSTESGMRAFMVNCNLIHPEISDKLNSTEIAKAIEKKYSKYYLVSEERCKSKIVADQFLKDPEVKKRYDVNQELVCNNKEIVKNTYLLHK